MEEVKKKNKYGFLFAILKVLAIALAVVAVVLIGLYIYIRATLGIDIFSAIRTVKKLGQDYNVSTVVDKPYDDSDIASAFLQFDNAGMSGFYTIQNGEYIINDDISDVENATQDIALTDKQLAAFLQTSLTSSLKISDGDIDLSFDIKQVKFSNFQVLETGSSVDMNVVMYTSAKLIKDELSVFPLTLLKKYIPDDIYVSATFRVQKNGSQSYIIEAISLKLNGLSASETVSLVGMFSKLGDFGDAYTLSAELGKIVMQGLVKGENGESGFVKELAPLGISDFDFELINNNICFVFKI